MASLANLLASRDRKFFDLFERSAQNAVHTAELLAEMLGEFPEKAHLSKEILLAEQEGDKITHEIVNRLNETFVTPIEREDILGRWIAYDMFHDTLVWAYANEPFAQAEWRPFTDNDYVDVRIRLEEIPVRPFGKELLRDVVRRVAGARRMDSAQMWLSQLRWDGVPRVDRYVHEYLGAVDDAYGVAVGRYAWSAMAARVVSPGCQTDMAVILVGEQGARKTSAIKAVAPHPDMYTTLSLHEHEDNQSRRLRGKLVVLLAR